MKFFTVLLLIILFILPSAYAFDSLKGIAQIEWVRKKKIYRFDEAILLNPSHQIEFETLDDFGNTLLKLDFTSQQLKKILYLPISREDFVAYLLYQIPLDHQDLNMTYDQEGHVVSLENKAKRKKEYYKINFLNFQKRNKMGEIYPQTIEFISKKTSLKITWKELQIK